MVFNKKGIVFTILALVISSFILMLFFYMVELPLDHRVDVTRARVTSVNNVLAQTESLAKAQAVTSSRQAINMMVDEMYVANSFTNNFDVSFVRCLELGEFFIGSVPLNCAQDNSFKVLIEDNLSNFLKDNVGMDVSFVVSNISLSQHTPWYLNVSFKLNMIFQGEEFFWNVSSNLSESFSILGFKDPMHAVVHSSLSSHKADFENITVISVDESFNNVTNDWREKQSTLNFLAKNNRYFEYDFAPSFLDRLRGNTSPSSLGIVNIVLPFESNGSVVRGGSSSLDWQFWQNHVVAETYGEYDFSSPEDALTVLGVSGLPLNLSNTIHRVIIPVNLAIAANVSNSSYFN